MNGQFFLVKLGFLWGFCCQFATSSYDANTFYFNSTSAWKCLRGEMLKSKHILSSTYLIQYLTKTMIRPEPWPSAAIT